MKGLPKAIVLGLLSSLVGEGREHPVPSGSRDGHQPIGIGIARLWRVFFCSEKLLSKEAGSPGLRYWGVGNPGPRPQGLPPTSRAAPRQPGSGAVCGFRISCRCHPERPADRQGSRPLSKTPFHLPGLITPAERGEGTGASPLPLLLSQLPSPLPREPISSLPSASFKALAAASAPDNYGSSGDKWPCLLGGRHGQQGAGRWACWCT